MMREKIWPLNVYWSVPSSIGKRKREGDLIPRDYPVSSSWGLPHDHAEQKEVKERGKGLSFIHESHEYSISYS